MCSKEEFLSLLKDNVTIELSSERGNYSTGSQDVVSLKLTLKFKDEVILESSTDLDVSKS